MGTAINQEVQITSLAFRGQRGGKQRLESYPRRMVWGNREYTFAELGMRYLVQKGQQLISLFDVCDGNATYRLRLENDRWTLVAVSGGQA